MSSNERTPLLPRLETEASDHHRERHGPDHLHAQREHKHHHHHHHDHHHGHHQADIQGGGRIVDAEQGELEDAGDTEVKENDPYVYLGFAFAIMAGFCFTSSNVMVKYIPEISSWQLLFVRCLFQLLSMVPIIISTKSNVFGTPDFATRWRVVAQGVLGGFLMLGIFQAVEDLPLGDATAIFFSSPAFTMILSTCLLRDHCGLFRTFIVTALLGGVVILSRPPAIFPPPEHIVPRNTSSNGTDGHHDYYEGDYNALGVSAAIMVPILSAWIVIITRQAKHVHYSVLVFWFGVGGLMVSIFGIYCLDNESQGLFENWNAREWVLSFMVALVGILGNIVMTKAVCWVTPSKVMVVRSFEVVIAYILQVTVFDTPTHLTDVGGTILIIIAVLGMGLEDRFMKRFKWRFL